MYVRKICELIFTPALLPNLNVIHPRDECKINIQNDIIPKMSRNFTPKVWGNMVHPLGVYFLFYLRKYKTKRNICIS